MSTSKNRELRQDWVLLGAAAVLAVVGFSLRGSGKPVEVGLRTVKTFTFVPLDRVNLACASSLPSLANCDAPTPIERIVPAVTVGQELLLVRGILAAPGFEAKGRAVTQRFQVLCNVTYRESVEGAAIRFAKREKFKPIDRTWLVDVDGCRTP